MAAKIPSSFPFAPYLLLPTLLFHPSLSSIPSSFWSHSLLPPPSCFKSPHSCSSISIPLSYLYLFPSIVLYFFPIPFTCLSYLLHYPHTLPTVQRVLPYCDTKCLLFIWSLTKYSDICPHENTKHLQNILGVIHAEDVQSQHMSFMGQVLLQGKANSVHNNHVSDWIYAQNTTKTTEEAITDIRLHPEVNCSGHLPFCVGISVTLPCCKVYNNWPAERTRNHLRMSQTTAINTSSSLALQPFKFGLGFPHDRHLFCSSETLPWAPQNYHFLQDEVDRLMPNP